MWKKDPLWGPTVWGPTVWCIIQRKQMPYGYAEKQIRKQGIWDLNNTNLSSNTKNEQIKSLFAWVISLLK